LSRPYTLPVALSILGALIIVASGALISYVTISNTGNVKTVGVGVYWEAVCTNRVSSISWGTIEPGSKTNVTVYIRNEGTSSATLSLSTSNWSPASASAYISLGWDYSGKVLSPNEVVQVKLTLSISSSITGITNFSFDITISAIG